MQLQIEGINKELQNASVHEVLKYFLEKYKDRVSLSSSFGAEDQVLTDLILNIDADTHIFTLDTGRLHPETYDVMDATNLKYNTKIAVYFPEASNVEALYRTQGVNGHYESIEKRKHCCFVRKIEPLQRALKDVDVWITGLRSEQSVTRQQMPLVEYDEKFKVIKVNPLIAWSEKEVWEYIKEHNVPYNKLHDQGFPSIGCAPCTRAVEEGEDIRSGRWWWESPEHKECGLHKGDKHAKRDR
ncbi:phosphoadenylyl-sulfate reductase [Sulfurovum sp. ST-21]|uniref:Adenosine 5'-phosphosulfate reductase n=1 Tax=Sulfurovum indicum TaxID=2779528 RepID=A0A7M1S3E4_9BACT|nr:phosphoadenylyl-sulfate reductase [Sulfurovum indicum]QOR61239.1 phosphoadenylyl-sulfate reductase [Sulfurovum indicum]